MLFNSVHFLIFFPCVTLVYFLLPFKVRWVWLLVASYYFYMSWNPAYALLIAFSTVVTFFCGLLVAGSEKIADEKKQKNRKRLWLVLSLVINLSILFLFKYFDFALSNLNQILGVLKLQLLQPKFDVLLPVGISFYTFQALGYTIDVYRGNVKAERNIGKYALFVSFFPQLVAGPIERSGNLIRQIHEDHPFNYQKAKEGLLIMLWGYFEKIVIADRAAVLVEAVFGNHTAYSGAEAAVAVVLFAVQIYGDFSGYSHIAIGAARVMGFDLMENFRQPYLALSIREFWQRWHISLSTWFKDYLYIPLGGNRKGKWRRYLNTMLTFLASGLWHGANWNFVAWGGLHGAYQVAGDMLSPAKKRLYGRLKLREDNRVLKVLKGITTFILVDFAWIFFRAPGTRAAFGILRSLFVPTGFGAGYLGRMGFTTQDAWVLGGAILLLFVVDILSKKRDVIALLERQRGFVRWAVYYLLLYVVLRYGVYGPGAAPSQFIYFQF